MTAKFTVSEGFINPTEMERKDARLKLDSILHMYIIQDIPLIFSNEKLQLYSDRIHDDVAFVGKFLEIIGYNQVVSGKITTERLNDVYYKKILGSLEVMYNMELTQVSNMTTLNMNPHEKFNALLSYCIQVSGNDIIANLDDGERGLLYEYYTRLKTYKEKKYSAEDLQLPMLYFMRAKYLESFIASIPQIENHRSLGCEYYKQQIGNSIKN